MNYAIQYWSPALQQYLKDAYRYEPSNGFVTRRLKDRGPVGSLTKNNDLLLGVTFEGRQYMIRVTKLAYFLQTGKQFHRFVWKDDNKLNNAFENLMAVGKELEPDMTYDAALEDRMSEQMRIRFLRQKEAQLKMQEKTIEAKVSYEQMKKFNGVRLMPLMSPEMMELKKRRDEKEKQEMLAQEREAKRVKNKEELDAIAQKNAAFIEKCKTTWRNGLYTGGNRKQADMFMEHCNLYSGVVKTHEELWQEILAMGDKSMEALAEDMEKWEYDRYFVAIQYHWLAEKAIAEYNLDNFLKDYKYKGQNWLGSYGEVPAAEQLQGVPGELPAGNEPASELAGNQPQVSQANPTALEVEPTPPLVGTP